MLKSIAKAGELLRQKKISPVELTEDCLKKIAELNPHLNAFITVTTDEALAQSRQAEEEIHRGRLRGPLHGIPIGLKDIIDTAGTRTTAASCLFKDRIPTENAEVVRRLKDAGAIFLGKQNLHEFAYGGSSMISCFGEVHNPWNVAQIAGGSSGGSAASVAAGLGLAAIGTDTAGSVREPAAQCGVVGLKPTYGRVSARGVVPLSVSLDHVGPLTRTVEDAALLLQAIAGFDPGDPASVDVPVGNYSQSSERGRFRVAIPRKFFCEDLDPEVGAAFEEAVSVLRTITTEISEIDLAVPTDRTLQLAESYAVHAEHIARTPELFQPETLRRIRAGEGISREVAEGKRRELKTLREEIGSIFEKTDLLVTPTVPIPAPQIAELKEYPDQLRPRELVLLRNTRPFNVWGLPAISVPCGFTRAGLPIGLQIAGPHWGEAKVLQLAYAYEQATAWHTREPKTPGR